MKLRECKCLQRRFIRWSRCSERRPRFLFEETMTNVGTN